MKFKLTGAAEVTEVFIVEADSPQEAQRVIYEALSEEFKKTFRFVDVEHITDEQFNEMFPELEEHEVEITERTLN